MKNTQIVFAAALLNFFSFAYAYAYADEYLYTGTFSDLRCVESEGDILGTEISILSGFNEESYSYYALVQFAEGAAAKP